METFQNRSQPRTTYAVLAALLLAASPLQVANAKVGSNMVAHKAFYQMEMGDRQQTSQIVNINGRSAFAIERDCMREHAIRVLHA